MVNAPRTNTLKILGWNVNGLRSILAKGFAQVLAEHQPDIVCVQEVKAFEKDVPNLSEVLPEYSALFSSAEKPGYSGVATFLRRSRNFTCGAVKTSLSDERDLFAREGRVLIMPVGDLLLYNLYFPSGTSGESRQAEKYRFLDLLLAHLSRLSPEERSKVVLCGDFNICHRAVDIHHPREAEKRRLTGFLPEERAWMDALVESGFIDTYRSHNPSTTGEYSWWTYRAGAREKNLGWRIDYQFVSPALASRARAASLLTSVTGSDHCPTLLTLSC
jgi:exodeoxyribonuclease-3